MSAESCRYCGGVGRRRAAQEGSTPPVRATSLSRSFTGSFVRQQNAMIRQLQLGDLRRRREEEFADTSFKVAGQRKATESFKLSAATEACRRAEALREGSRQERRELERKREEVEAMRERELDMVRLKQSQLREIRSMLAQPIDMATGLPSTAAIAPPEQQP